MSRSLRKSIFIKPKLINILMKDAEGRRLLSVVSSKNRATAVVPALIGLNLEVYNGKTVRNFQITNAMLGDKLGEYSFTRKLCKYKKKKKQKKNFR